MNKPVEIPIVKKEDERPAGKGSGHCFYCPSKIGKPHAKDCVLYTKTVTIRMIIEYPIEVPNAWDKDRIEFHRNESSWCVNNAIDELQELDKENGCFCGVTKFELVE